MVPIAGAVVIAGIVGALASRYSDGAYSFSYAFGWTLAVILGTAGWFLGLYFLYETAARRLGWECATGPQVSADGRSVVADVLIRGEHRGRQFTLSRVKSTSSGRRTVFSSRVEWTGSDIRVPIFSLRVTGAVDAGLARWTGTEAMAEALIGAVSRHESLPPVPLDESTRLARRSRLAAPDAAAARAYFNPVRCDALDGVLAKESLDGEPGRIALHAASFPLPWQLEAFLDRAEAVREALLG